MSEGICERLLICTEAIYEILMHQTLSVPNVAVKLPFL
jgi:hypothetical protein